MPMMIDGMEMLELNLPAKVRLYPRSTPGYQVDQVPRVFALEWLAGGLLCQFRQLVLPDRIIQIHYRIVSWAELADVILLVEDKRP